MVDFSPCASDASNVRFWIEDAIKDHVPYLRQCICKAWNESGRYQSVLRAYKKKPLKFVSEEEREAFLAFCEKEISNCPFAMNPYEYPEDTTELIGALVDDLNGCEWESSMSFDDGFKLGESLGLAYTEGGCETGTWDVDYALVAREIRDFPKYTGHTVRSRGIAGGVEVKCDRLTEKYTF